jgi:hypothetical protein
VTRFPLRYARGNLLFGRGDERAALYRLETVSYPYLPAADKWTLLRRCERLASVVGADFSLWRVNRARSSSQHADELAHLLDPRRGDPEGWRRYLDSQAARLGELASHVPEVYLAVSLKQAPAVGLGAGLVRSADRARRRVEEIVGAGRRPVAGSELEALAAAEQRVFDRLRAAVRVRRATTRELEWLLRRAATRGLAEPASDPHWMPDALVVETPGGEVAYEPLEHDFWRFANEPLTEDPGEPPSLAVDAEEGRVYQALLALGALADEPVFPGAESELLFAPLEGLDFPVDAVFHARWLGNREALAQVRKGVADTEHAYREQLTGSPVGAAWTVEDDRVLAREYEAVLAGAAHPPMLHGAFALAVAAHGRDELERRVAALRDRFGDVELHRPRGLQHQLYYDHLPRCDAGATRDYTEQVTVEQFGASVPIATEAVGADRGPYIGWAPASGGRAVLIDVTAPSRLSRSPAVILAGAQGSGKTVAAQALAFSGERRGSQLIDLDPRPDHGWEQVPELEGRVAVIELSGDEEQRGRLDPLAIGLADMREELAASYFLELLRDPPPVWENAIQRAVRDTVREGGRSSLLVIEKLRRARSPEAREAGDALEVAGDFGVARLAFGTGAEAAETVAAPVMTIRTPGLTLPEAEAAPDSYTRAERVSVATLSLVAALAMRLVAADRSRHKVVLLDEAWFLLASRPGRALINRLVRLARAYNATVLIATQRLGDLGELADLIGQWFVFELKTEDEAKRALGYLALDTDDPARIQQLRELPAGRCLMRDLDGRVGELKFDLAPAHLLEAFATDPPGVPA